MIMPSAGKRFSATSLSLRMGFEGREFGKRKRGREGVQPIILALLCFYEQEECPGMEGKGR